MITVELLPPEALATHKDGLIAAYHATYQVPPYKEPFSAAQEFGEGVLKEALKEGFRCVIARDDQDDRIIGFAYGIKCLAGWWRDTVTRGLSKEEEEEWFSNTFEFIEFGVIPAFQGQGIGSRIYQKLLKGLDYRTAVLNVMQADIPAFHLYQKRGWIPIRKDFLYHEGNHPCTIMGLDLANLFAA